MRFMLKSIQLLLVVTTAGALGAGVALAQESACSNVYANPQIGDYAEMRFSSPEQGIMEVRFSVVASEPVEGVQHYWLELNTTPPNAGGPVIAQMLVPGYPFDAADIKGYIIQLPGQPARRVPQRMLDQMASSVAPNLGWENACRAADDLGVEEVKVPAGAFEAHHLRTRDDEGQTGDIWYSTDVAFGMVKVDHPDGQMRLLAVGTGATPSFDPGQVPEMTLPAPPND